MSNITAYILINSPDQKFNGIISPHYITLYEGDRPSLSLCKVGTYKEIIRISPSTDKLVDNIYLLIYAFVLKAEIFLNDSMDGNKILKLYNDKKKEMTCEQIMTFLETSDLKVVFNILDGSTLLNQLDRIKDYPVDFEVTTPKFKRETDFLTGKVKFKEF